MLPGLLNCSSANFMSLRILQLSSIAGGVVSVMLVNTAQSSVVCQSVCLDLKCSETLWCVAVFTLLISRMDVCLGPWQAQTLYTPFCYKMCLTAAV
jgi:hypothetical protein